jgi:adenine C2-methylase RlmN of 23S rRNA A2503 and tRNA A37
MMVNFSRPLKMLLLPAYKALESNGIVVKVRRSRGKDIDAGAISNKQA